MRVTCTRIYGKGCYELSGERDKRNESLENFISNMLNLDCGDKKSKREHKIPEELIDEIMDGIRYGEIGDSYGISYYDLKVKDGSSKAKEEDIRKILENIPLSDDEFENIEDRSLERILRI